MNPAFWRGKRVLITGHTGFKGSWLSLWLQLVGADAVGYALEPPTDPAMFTLASVADGMVSILGDIRDVERLRRAIAGSQPEIVFHMAAQPLVRESYKDPITTYATNVMGMVHLLESARHAGSVRAVVCITSDKCYENREQLWGYRENEAMGGYDPYSSSKGCAEIVAAAYRRSFFNPSQYAEHRTAIATARAGNVMGGGDWAKDRLVPDILRSLVQGETVILRNPQATRPWQHVLEPLSGYLTLAERLFENGPGYSEGWNFGPFDSGMKPVSWVVERLVSLWGSDIAWKQEEAYQPHEDNYLTLDCAKARRWLQWEPLLDITTALRWTVEWIKSWQAGADMRRVSESQVGRFMELAQRQPDMRPIQTPLPAPVLSESRDQWQNGSPPSNEVQVTAALSNPNDTEPPSVPGDLNAWEFGREIWLFWTPSTDNEDSPSKLAYEVAVDGRVDHTVIGRDRTILYRDQTILYGDVTGANCLTVAAIDIAGNRSAPAVLTLNQFGCQ
jgi:CDP-glucose 4,6-dehydratase